MIQRDLPVVVGVAEPRWLAVAPPLGREEQRRAKPRGYAAVEEHRQFWEGLRKRTGVSAIDWRVINE
jgi:hypothetical protein